MYELKRSRVVLALNVLILVAIIAAASVLALLVVGGAASASSLSIGSPTTHAVGGLTEIAVPIQIGNHGYFSLSDIAVSLAVTDAAGAKLLAGTLGPFTVGPGQTQHVTASLVLSTAGLSAAELQSLATSPQDLTVSASLAASVPPFVGVTGSVSAQLSWGAPVSGLTVGQPTFSQYNSTAIEASVPVTFTNDNAYLAVSGDGLVSVLNSSGQKVGSGSVTLDVQPGSQFNQAVNMYIGIPAGQLQSLLTQDQTLGYTAVLSLPTWGSTFTMTEPFTYGWGAPMKGLSVGALAVSPVNATDSSATAPLTFTDASSFLSVSGTVSGTITTSSGTVVGAVSPASVSVSPGQSFSGTISGLIQNSALGQGSYVLHLTFATQYGAFTTEVTVTA